MREKILFICLACLPVLLFAQEQAPGVNKNLQVGQELVYNYTSVEFIKVLSDSRCPKQVACIWAGEASVLLGITIGEKDFEKEIVLSGSGAEVAFQEDLQILVSHLKPYPETAKGIAQEEYCLEVSLVPGKNQ